jgi:hypothetical protein
MSPRSDISRRAFAPAYAALLWALLNVALGTVVARAQSAPDLSGDSVTAARDTFLAEHALLEPLAASLWDRFERAQGTEKVTLAESLGRLYARMLADAKSPHERQRIEHRCRRLLSQAPDSEVSTLRLTIAIAEFLPMEEIVERHALRLASAEDHAEASRVLRSVRPVIEELAGRLNARAAMLKRRKDEGSVKEGELDLFQEMLDEANSMRSRAWYYAGWANYYTAALHNDTRAASSALVYFGGILNAVSGRPASLERLPEGHLRYDHVAKSALGCGLASSILGNHVEAVRWIEVVEHAPDINDQVRAQVFRRKVSVLAAADRWADIEAAVARARIAAAAEGASVGSLNVADARSLAVTALESLKNDAMRPALRASAEKMAQIALGDLVSTGRIGHVLSLVSVYGTQLIGKEGFINLYVRARQLYEQVRAAHAGQGPADEPVTDPALVNQYRQAADLFFAAAQSSDAAGFDVEQARAMLCRGLSLYYAGGSVAAADAFEAITGAGAASGDLATIRADALWYAVVSLDSAITQGGPSHIERRDRLATLYIKSYPRSERSVKLLMRRIADGREAQAEDIETLLRVPFDSALYSVSRRVAAGLLYNQFRRADASSRDFAALRFVTVVEDVLRAEHTAALAGRGDQARAAADLVILHARQLCHAALAMTTPDTARAESAMALVDGVALFHGVDTKEFAAEFLYRRLQIALARRDDSQMRTLLDALRVHGGPLATGAERLVFQHAWEQWQHSPDDAEGARRVVSLASRLLSEMTERADRASLSMVRDRLASAATKLWKLVGDERMRDLARATDEAQLKAGVRTLASLRRLADVLEATGESESAVACWEEILIATEPSTPVWCEARFNSLRLLASLDSVAAHRSYRQFVTMYPAQCGEVWKDRFIALNIPEPASPDGGAP